MISKSDCRTPTARRLNKNSSISIFRNHPDSPHKLKALNLGKIIPGLSEPKLVKACDECTDPELVIEYGDGDACENDAGKNRSSKIKLLCDPSKIESEPTLISDNGCETEFEWLTAYACSISKEETFDNCTAVNPVTKHVFDLNKIFQDENEMLKFTDQEENFDLGICKHHNACPSGSGLNEKPINM